MNLKKYVLGMVGIFISASAMPYNEGRNSSSWYNVMINNASRFK